MPDGKKPTICADRGSQGCSIRWENPSLLRRGWGLTFGVLELHSRLFDV
jgi:hypothetical protein